MYGFSTSGFPARETFATPVPLNDGMQNANGPGPFAQNAAPALGGAADAVVRSMPFVGPLLGGGGVSAGPQGLSSLIGLFANFIQQIFAQLGTMLQGGQAFQGAQPPPGAQNAPGQCGSPQQFFTNADASSVGDPHDAFIGTSSGGRTEARWDDMHSHQDLLSSDSFPGGYRVSTRVTTPANGGATLNSAAIVSLGRGNSSVTVNADGTSSIVASGRAITLVPGEKSELGNGASVMRNADGSFTVDAENGNGGRITTQLAPHNGGVDVTNHAENVDLGGYLATRTDDATRPPMQRYAPGLRFLQ